LSPAAYRDRGDAICAAAQKRLARIAPPRTAAQIEPFLARSLAAVAPSLDALRRLEPPRSLQARADRYLTLQARQQDALEELLARIRRGADPERTWDASTPAIDRRTARITAAAHAIGFRVCGVGGTTG
jgi:hypothetical protein